MRKLIFVCAGWMVVVLGITLSLAGYSDNWIPLQKHQLNPNNIEDKFDMLQDNFDAIFPGGTPCEPCNTETPSPTPTNTPTHTPTQTPTNTPTNTPTQTPTQTATPIPTPNTCECSGTMKVAENLMINEDGPEGDSHIYFWNLGIPDGAYISWDDSAAAFDISNEIFVGGNIKTDHDVIAQSLLLQHSDIYMNYDGPDGGATIYFYNDGAAVNEMFYWNDTLDRFGFTDDLYIGGGITTTSSISVSGGGLFSGDLTFGENILHNGDTDTGITAGTDNLYLGAGGLSFIRCDGLSAQKKLTVNNSGSDMDLAVEMSGGTEVFTVNAGTGDVSIASAGTLKAAYDTDTTHYIARCAIGGSSDAAIMGHLDVINGGGYQFKYGNDGAVNVNYATAKRLNIRLNDTIIYRFETDGDFDPQGTTLDCGSSTNHFDSIVATSFDAPCDAPPETLDPLAAVLAVDYLTEDAPDKSRKRHVDHDSIPDWVRGHRKAYDENGRWKGSYRKNGKPVSEDEVNAASEVNAAGEPDPDLRWDGEYTSELNDSYSINRMQLVMIEAIKILEKRLTALEEELGTGQ